MKIKEHPRLSSDLQEGMVAYMCTHTHVYIHKHNYMHTCKIKFMFADTENYIK